MKKTLISLFLVLSMLLSCILPVVAVESPAPGTAVSESAEGPLSLGNTTIPPEEVVSGFAPAGEAAEADADGVKVEEPADGEAVLEPSADRFSDNVEAQAYAADEEVTFIVVLKTLPLLKAGFTTDEIANATKAVVDYQVIQQKAINAVRGSVTAKLDAEIGFTYTIATTGLSVRTAYGNKAALEAMDGVDYVYVAPTFSVPETEELTPSTSNATTMIGADWMNSTGFTGKGMKIAILDTGLWVDHPNFAALSEDKLTEASLTRESVEEIWNTLNAGQMTSMLNTSYKSSKVPYAFNYVNGTFDVSNTFAGSDHGTHVAGIAAANKIDGSEVVGVAPDAQVIVMQVFQQGGGAAWDTIMAALEDAVRLDADSVNLSLGAAAGFTDPDSETGAGLLAALNLYVESDIEVLIASGNDTNNAYMNLWGLDMSLSGNPDIGLSGTPGTYSAALSVASVDNDGATLQYFTTDGAEVGFTDTATTAATKFQANFSAGQELTYVAVPGLGEAKDYEGLDVTGKVALVQRGTLSFPEKQANAQAAGAIAIIVYNNVDGVMINMQINDGEGNIPAIFIQKKDGDAMAAKGAGTLTVSDGSAKLFKVKQAISSFSSWGVTPDLKLKPEIAGVGGSIYATVDPAISGSNYGYMSGTSMATPQVTGAMAVLMQYLRENFDYEGAELRQVAANLMMSTANPIQQGAGEYSPRAQGAGLVDLENAVNAKAYLSNAAATEGRPKAEFGDDPERTGVYEFSFQITNMETDTKSYTLDASVLTETLYAGYFIANESYVLDAGVEFFQTFETEYLKYDFNHDGTVDTADARVLLRHVNGVERIAEDDVCYPYADVNADGTADKADVDVITAWCAGLSVDVDLTAKILIAEDEAVTAVEVGPNATVTVNVKITLTDEDKAYMAAFENGIYVEGYVYVNNAEDGKSLNLPFVGFYGDWSDAPVFDEAEEETASLYPLYVYTYNTLLGVNPYIRNGRGGDEYNAFSYSNPLTEIDIGMLRNARDLLISVTNVETGEVYYELDGSYLAKTFYSPTYGVIIPLYLMVEYGEIWDGKDAKGNLLPDGTKIEYRLDAWLDDGDDILDDSIAFQATVDDTAPEVLNQFTLNEDVLVRISDNHILLPLEIEENEHVAAVFFLSPEGNVMGKYEIENTPGEAETFYFDITGYGTEFTIIVADYACNETEFDVMLNLGEFTDAEAAMKDWDSGRIYGCETFDGAAIEGGWFSANKADLSDVKNETFDSSKRYYSAEFVNGYLIAQSATTGNLELITPTNTYWGATTLVEQYGSVGESGVWVLYDMALDHSGTVTASYGVNLETDATDGLLAVGWMYRGDQDNDGHDDGYNALFNVKFTNNGSVYVQEIAPIVGTENGGDLLTLGITTEGKIYGIDTDGILYSVATTTEWDDSFGEWGSDVVNVTKIGVTDFVSYPGYGGANVIQSMGYDHNTGTMYWFAHSQVPNGNYYDNINVTYQVNLETAECTEVGTYGRGGQTALFIPNDLESDLFVMGVDPKGFRLDPYSLTMAQTQTKRLKVIWDPWNANAVDLTWTSDNEAVAIVDAYGLVTAVGEGTATISATGTIMLGGEWGWDENSNWVYIEPYEGEYTATCTVTVVPSQDEIYGFMAEDFSTTELDAAWITYSDVLPTDLTDLGQQLLPGKDADGNDVMVPALWQGGAYFNGYVYTTISESKVVDNVIYNGTALYKSKVTKTEDGVTFGEPEYIGFQEGVLISALGFDYNTSRMYCVENQYIGGLGIIDLDTGAVDMLGQPNGDLSGGVYIPGLCVTADGTIVISDAVASLYTIDPDTLTTRQIHRGEGNPYTAFFEGMCYDYDTGNIYWNMCDGTGASPLYLVIMPESEWDSATVMNLGAVSTKKGTEQTVMFTISENEPEAKVLPVESIEITNGEAVSGLQNGTLQLNTLTVPARPTVQAKTWTSSDESVVTVDRYGKLTYVGVGTATVTVSITNKDEATYGGPFTDSIQVTVLESAGQFVAFLTSDENGGTGYCDFWLNGEDYDLRHTAVGESMLSIYSLRTGNYYDGYFYAVNDKGQFMRIDAENPASYKILGTVEQTLTAMAMDYTTGTMYGLTLTNDYDYNNWVSVEEPGALVKVDLDTGALTEVAKLDFNEPVYALACDANGVLYAAGGTRDYYASYTNLYTVDKSTAALTKVLTIDGANVYTGGVYYGTAQYNAQLTYDFGTNRLYLYATSDHPYTYSSYGMYMVQLGDTPTASYLDGISLVTRGGSVKYGDVYLGLLAFIPEADEVPVGKVNGIILNKTSSRVAVGTTAQLTAEVRPSNAADKSLTWKSSNEAVATVDTNGLVTGVSVGTATITVTSNETGASATSEITVVSLEGPQSTAYTVSAQKDALISFNPALPGQTAETVASLSGGSSIKGMTYGKDCLYYVMEIGYSYYLYRYDFTSKQSVEMGQLEAWTGVDGIAYDAQNDLLYAVGGFYLFQYNMANWKQGEYNSYSNYVMDSDYSTLAGVAVVDGAVYVLGNDYYTSVPQLIKYSDKYLSDRQVYVKGFDLNVVAGATDLAYDAGSGLFYVTDAGHNIYSFDLNQRYVTGQKTYYHDTVWDYLTRDVYSVPVVSVDMLGDGIDLNGLAIVPAAEEETP